ncbi:hypothetical protein NDU88_008554 [Pleurodeles waltl]|uniref:Uncharacterized protein n=1 Tax=Pleurodeles waltl TaxID=8319 RepID=A0AAV7N5A6_PLEWA|nr:hypothetical protein NDU88_008554 [Pleurodeles waltl]
MVQPRAQPEFHPEWDGTTTSAEIPPRVGWYNHECRDSTPSGMVQPRVQRFHPEWDGTTTSAEIGFHPEWDGTTTSAEIGFHPEWDGTTTSAEIPPEWDGTTTSAQIPPRVRWHVLLTLGWGAARKPDAGWTVVPVKWYHVAQWVPFLLQVSPGRSWAEDVVWVFTGIYLSGPGAGEMMSRELLGCGEQDHLEMCVVEGELYPHPNPSEAEEGQWVEEET